MIRRHIARLVISRRAPTAPRPPATAGSAKDADAGVVATTARTGAGNAGGGRAPLGDRYKNYSKTSQWAKECRGKKKDVAHIAQDEEEGVLMYVAGETQVTMPPKIPFTSKADAACCRSADSSPR
jgi:hypothetical protein